jgi:hypothetical protein
MWHEDDGVKHLSETNCEGSEPRLALSVCRGDSRNTASDFEYTVQTSVSVMEHYVGLYSRPLQQKLRHLLLARASLKGVRKSP